MIEDEPELEERGTSRVNVLTSTTNQPEPVKETKSKYKEQRMRP